VTILLVNSDDASVSELDAQFKQSKITNYVYKPASSTTPPTTWPTLQELINANTRLMVFVASLKSASISVDQSYLMDEFTFMFENPYDNVEISDFKCTPDRPSSVKGNSQAAISSNRMPLMNHFRYEEGLFDIQTPNVDNITMTNSPGTQAGNLGKALSDCTAEYSGKVPTFTLVDFFSEGPAIDAVDKINGITPTGRTALPPRDTRDDLTDPKQSSFQNVIDLNNDIKNGQNPKVGAWIWAAGDWSFGGINLNGGDILS
jgi:hypothetical protein